MFKTYELTKPTKEIRPMRLVEWGKLGRKYGKESREALRQKVIEDCRKEKEQQELEE